MSRWITGAIAVTLCCVLASAQLSLAQDQADASASLTSIHLAERPQFLVSVLPDSALDGVYEQSQFLLTIRVASKYPFDALTIDFPAIDNAEQIPLAAPRTRKIKSYAGEGYLHERRYAVFPTAPGRVEIPPSSVTGVIDSATDGQVEFSAAHGGTRIPVLPSPAGYGVDWWLVSANIAMEESWSIPVDQLRQGDVVTRTITLRAAGVDEKRLPVLNHGSTRGVSVRELESTRQTIASQNGLDGVLTSSWALRIDGDGFVYVPPLGIAYWDPLAKTRRTAAVRGHRIEPLPVDGEALAAQLLHEAAAVQRTAYQVLMTLLLLLGLPLLAAGVYALVKVFNVFRDRRFSRRFLQADSARSAYRAWQRWAADERLLDDARWRSLNRRVQAAVFSTSPVGNSLPDRRSVLREVLSCARKCRWQRLRGKCSVLINFFVGPRAELGGGAVS